jgi:hypothetical protein
MIKNPASKIRRKIKFGINIPLKVFKKPSFPKSVTSDLFPIRNDSHWTTEFEFLNLPGLIEGSISGQHKARMVFFDQDGFQLCVHVIEINGHGRKTINLKEILGEKFLSAATFAIFHEVLDRQIDLNGSFLAERGYTGYGFNGNPVKGYVHGNLDAISYFSGGIQKLGNFGIRKKNYVVQHLLTGPSSYDFFITNPTSKRMAIQFSVEINGNKKNHQQFKVPSLGCRNLHIDIHGDEVGRVRIKSLLYLGRPVIFRTTHDSFDVFHG